MSSVVVVSPVVDSPGRVGSAGTGLVGPVVCGIGWVGREGSTVPGTLFGEVGWVWVVGTCATAVVAPPRISRLAKMVLRIECLLASSRNSSREPA